jgi:hypothetical protein
LADCPENPAEFTVKPDGQEFRPFQEVDRLARSKACDEMFGVLLKMPEASRNNRSDICEALYDAGYRKQVQP